MTHVLTRSLEDLLYWPSRAICIPTAPRVPNPPRLSAILDMKLMQRLRSVRQLALAHLVYPDATHPRFGHSLGVFHRAGTIVRAIVARPENAAVCEEIGPKEIAALLAAALLHDAGHYPMAHSFEELIPAGAVMQLLKHDQVLVRMLRGELPGVLSDAERARLADALREWEGISIDDVLAILTGYPKYATTITNRAEVLRVLHGLLDGPFDADKLDYVQRDARHTGHPLGESIDEERLVDSIVIRSFIEGMGIAEDGLYAAQSLHSARAAMFKAVYWHRTNRIANRMFSEALYMLSESSPSAVNDLFQEEIFRLNDEEVLMHVQRCVARNDARAAMMLVEPLKATSGQRNQMYRRVLTVAAPGIEQSHRVTGMPASLHGRVCYLYDAYLEKGRGADAAWRFFETTIRSQMMQLAGTTSLFEVLVDVPDSRFETPVHDDPSRELGRSGFWVFSGNEAVPVAEKDPLFGAVLANWRLHARKVRLIASPDIAGTLESKKSELMGLMRETADTAMAMITSS